MQQVFALFASLALVCASLVVRSNNPVHSVLFLILTFVNACGILFVVDLEFYAILFLVVYVGAIAVLFLFVVMMLDQRTAFHQKTRYTIVAPVYAILFVGFLFSIVHTQFYPQTQSQTSAYIWIAQPYTNIHTLGNVLYTQYAGLFLISSVLLLIAMIGAIVLTMNKSSSAYTQDVSLQNRRDYKQSVAKLRQIYTTRE